jgi:hypothetical protein
LALLAWARGAAASDALPTEADATAYCAWVGGVARSQSDLLLAPSLLVSYGYVNETLTAGAALTPSTQRLTAGLAHNLVGVYQGMIMRQQARADCARYRTASQLHAFLVSHKQGGAPEAFAARVAVLNAALPEAEKIAADLEAQVHAERATVEELNATQLRVDELRQLLEDARRELEAAPRLDAPRADISRLLRRRDLEEDEVARLEAQLRESQAFSVNLRGGYDQVFGLPKNSAVPLFAIATLTVNLGVIGQPAAEAQARTGHRALVRAQIEGLDQRVEEVRQRLRAEARAEARRLHQTTVLLADLEERLRSVDALPFKNEKTKRYREYLWFDWVKTHAEHDYLDADLRALQPIVGAETP